MLDSRQHSTPSSIFSKVIIFLILGIGTFFFLKSFTPTISTASAQGMLAKKIRTFLKRPHKRVCSFATGTSAQCDAHVTTDTSGNPLVVTAPVGINGPVQIHTAYQLPCTPGGLIQSICNTPSNFGPTIALVAAYNDPTVESDLNTYSQAYGLPACTKANGCLQVVNQQGGIALPPTNSGWALEMSLDVQTAHAVCQTCKILLVEAQSNSLLDLGTAVNRAVIMGAIAVSNSWGATEWSGETSYDSYFTHPGTVITASSGDTGNVVNFPAASPGVLAVGGTTLTLNTDNSYNTESVWNDGGSGCSQYEKANVWQTGLSNWGQTGCGIFKATADVAADADPNTGVAVYDSTAYQGHTGWYQVGGTSLASPLVAAIFALSGGVSSGVNAASVPYQFFSSSNAHDVVTGSNGICGTIMCNATLGFDGPTGLGSPNGVSGFGGLIVTPTATPTPTPTGLPTATPTPTVVTPTPTPTLIPTVTPTPTPLPFTISGISVSNISSSRATIKWTTSVGATGKVLYGKSANALTLSSAQNNSFLTSHSIVLTSLSRNTTYYFSAVSQNASSVSVFSPVQSFKTSRF